MLEYICTYIGANEKKLFHLFILSKYYWENHKLNIKKQGEKMVAIFFRNLLRSLCIAILSYIVIAIVLPILAVIWDVIFVDLFKLKFLSAFNIIALMVISAILAFIVSFFLTMIFDSEILSFGNDEFYVNNCPKFISIVINVVLSCLIIVAVCSVLLCFYYVKLSQAFAKNDWLTFAVIVPSIFIGSPIGYLFTSIWAYGMKTCSKCKHVFCLDYKSTLKDSYDTISYKDKIRNETVGTIKYGSESVDIKADVLDRQYTKTKHKISEIEYTCKLCGDSGKYNSHSKYSEKL